MNTFIGLVGGAIGQWFAPVKYAQLGWAVGSALFSELFASKPSYESGKLSDLKFSGSSFGVPWPRVWGEGVVGGNVIWCATDADGNHLRQTKERHGGGSTSPSRTTYKTYTTAAVVFAQGAIWLPDSSIPVDEGEYVYRNHRMKRIWANDVLIYEEEVAGTVTVDKHNADVTHRGSSTQSVWSAMTAWAGGNPVSAHEELVYGGFQDMEITDYGASMPQFRAQIATDAVDAVDVISDLCRTQGLKPTQFDASACAGITVRGLVWEQRDSVRVPLEALMVAYDIDVADFDRKLYFFPRGSGSVYDIDAEWLIANPTKISINYRNNQTDLPGLVTVKFFDVNSLFEANSVDSPRVSDILENDRTLTLPLALTEAEAETIAMRELDRAWIEDQDITIFLPMRYIKFAPGDRIRVPIREGVVRQYRITSVKLAPLGEISISAVIEDPDIAIQNVSGGGGGNGSSGTLPVVPSLFYPFSAREILDEHQVTAGFYVAVSGGDNWRGGQVWYLPPGGSEWLPGPVVSSRTAFGSSTSALSSSGAVAGVRDSTNTVDLDLSASLGDLSTVEDVAVDSGQNWAWLGDEIIGFSVATLTGTNQYTISEILRGLRSTPMTGHTSSDPFVLALSTDSVARVQVPDAHVGLDYDVKVVSVGQDIADVTAQTVTIIARTPTATESTAASIVRPIWLATPVTVQSSTTGTVSWATFDASASIPDGAVAAIVEVEYGITEPDSGSPLDAYVKFRSASGTIELVGARGRASGTADNNADCSQVMVPISSLRHFDYDISAPGFDLGCELRLVGYWGNA